MRYVKIGCQFLISPILWMVYFLSGFFLRDRTKILFGTHISVPAGNILAHYRDVRRMLGAEYKIYWVVDSNEKVKKYQEIGFLAINKYSYKGILLCLSSQFYCFSQHVNDISFAFSRNATKINLWHGTPIKKIERDIETGIYSIRYKYWLLFKIIQPWVFERFDKIFCSCLHDCNVFSSAFKLENSQLYKTFSPRLSPLKNVSFEKNNTILIAPTFRDDGDFDYGKIIDFIGLSELGKKFSSEIKIKLHPADRSIIKIPDTITNISLVNKDVDFYDLLQETKLLITDYSSVFFDAFSLNLPVIFYWPDYHDFMKYSREFYLRMEDVCPELICYDMEELKKLISYYLVSAQKIKSELFAPYSISNNYPYEIYKQ
ncbi:TPA: CDP-glycerol glycerophosphotransferase family protein [Citrobacter koseri]|uniref:CDP-glycerol glycerophosphotransferase family protein n=1 Tax=Citrobacter koseri TaxID=545 RepID=UPI002AB495C6|nr:CDP-glycerol glycerophosphotransferase family protein [Citrobacter koseri]HCR9748296.1 CDP-glycerol glycerophosphotransferase family protein [Citrobacter koseri]HCR9768064.1 CDP-glycerol glycerophosphotransferase family protein [Citrobacter koseri]HEM7946956.1 CDP-glycerol glycerophosphotransferase family protein [Citrobacter koseri]